MLSSIEFLWKGLNMWISGLTPLEDGRHSNLGQPFCNNELVKISTAQSSNGVDKIFIYVIIITLVLAHLLFGQGTRIVLLLGRVPNKHQQIIGGYHHG